jgi:hypothetical protein
VILLLGYFHQKYTEEDLGKHKESEQGNRSGVPLILGAELG